VDSVIPLGPDASAAPLQGAFAANLIPPADIFIGVPGTAGTRPRLPAMHSKSSLVMMAAAFAIIASVTIFGKAERTYVSTAIVSR